MNQVETMSDCGFTQIQLIRFGFQFNKLYHERKQQNNAVNFKSLFRDFYVGIFGTEKSPSTFGFMMGRIGCITREIDRRHKQREILRMRKEEEMIREELIKQEFSIGDNPPKEGSTALLDWQIKNGLVNPESY